jgi:hypothetical protein
MFNENTSHIYKKTLSNLKVPSESQIDHWPNTLLLLLLLLITVTSSEYDPWNQITPSTVGIGWDSTKDYFTAHERHSIHHQIKLSFPSFPPFLNTS